MQKEIGSEFEFDFDSIMSNEENDLKELFPYSDYHYVTSGRSGIKQILMNLVNDHVGKKEEFLLPSYLCPSIVQAYKELDLNIIYYNVNHDLRIDTDDLISKVTEKTRAIYFINYFGALQPKEVISDLLDLKKNGIILIEDITHNLFSQRQDIGDYLVGSLRKWGPLPQGGIVIVTQKPETYKTFYEKSKNTFRIGQLKAFAQQLKYLYLNGINDAELKNTYLRIFNATNDALYSFAEIVPIDDLSLNIFKRLEFSKLIMQRRENYQFLFNRAQNIKDIHLVLGDIEDRITPLGFHVSLDNRNELRNFLIKNNVYASIHWVLPEEVQSEFEDPCKLSSQILTIPCDQRYGEKDMEFIGNLIEAYFGRR